MTLSGYSVVSSRLVWVLAILFLAMIAYFQTYSLWLPVDEKVDESELVYYAVGFFGFDFNPHWYGYGNLGMYLLYVWYIVLYFFQLLTGGISNLDDYAQQLFYSEFFIDAGRYLYALFGVLTIAIYTAILHRSLGLKISWVFFVASIIAGETIYYANYIRPDQLVSLLVACLVYSVLFLEGKTKIYAMAVITAALVTTKISTIPLGAVLAFSLSYSYLFTRQISLVEAVKTVLLFSVAAFLFQPYSDPVSTIISFGEYLSPDPVLSGLSVFDRWQNAFFSIMAHMRNNVSSLLLYLLPLLIFIQKQYRLLLGVMLVIIVLLILPYSIGNGIIRAYWLNPVYDMLRFLAVLSLANLLEIFLRYANVSISGKWVNIVLALVIFLPVYNGLQGITHTIDRNEVLSNSRMAKAWINENLLGNESIMLDTHFNHVLPKIYHADFVRQSKAISRAFYFNRKKNQYLNQQFELFLQRRAAIPRVSDKVLKKQGVVNVDDAAERGKVQGGYFITSPAIYQRMRNKNTTRSGGRFISLDKDKTTAYYNYMLREAPVKVFKNGRGAQIEIYRLSSA